MRNVFRNLEEIKHFSWSTGISNYPSSNKQMHTQTQPAGHSNMKFRDLVLTSI